MTKNVEIHCDIRLEDPSSDELADALLEVETVANALAMNGHIGHDGLVIPDLVGEGHIQAIAGIEEGWEAADLGCLEGVVAVAGIAWWTSTRGTVHVRVCGGVGLHGKYQPVWMPTGVLYDLGEINLFDERSAWGNVHPEMAHRLVLQVFGRQINPPGAAVRPSRYTEIGRSITEFGGLMNENAELEMRN